MSKVLGFLGLALLSFVRAHARFSPAAFRRAALPLALAVAWLGVRPAAADVSFTNVVVDPGQTPWGKNLADVDNDGFADALEGGGSLGGNVYWCGYGAWNRYLIGSSGGGDDLQVGDFDNDGAVDVVVNGNPTIWYENPRGNGGDPKGLWIPHTIDNIVSHDLDVADINSDGKLDVLSRVDHGATYVYLQNGPNSWTRITMTQAETAHQGAAFADINADGRVDVVGNGYWLQQPSDPVNGTWTKRVIGSFPSCSIDTGDLNGDGRLDVTFGISEAGAGSLAWFQAPSDPVNGTWIRHDIGAVEEVHRHHLVDMDRDGDRDIVFAEMHQSSTDRVAIYWNQGAGASFSLQVFSNSGSHNIAVVDIERDGDLDILGSNWNTEAPDRGGLRLWVNQSTITGVGGDEALAPPRVLPLGNAPNPFGGNTEIRFQVEGTLPPGDGWTLRVFDVHGRLVRTVREVASARQISVPWDGATDSGSLAPAGIYYYRIESGALRSGGRMTLVR